jgi:RNA polymerase sigma factor (sigma-70 family)
VFTVQADHQSMTPRALFHPARLARRPVLSTQSDERLVDLVRAGSDPAFEAIVERYRRALMRYVSRLLPAERAEDVVQQAFLKAYEAMHRDASELHLRPWLYRIAHNGAVNALRDRGLTHAELDERLDGVERPDQAFERTLGLRELVVAVQALPERQRDAILLRELEGRSYEEIAAALGVTDGAVRQLLNRARNTLRATAAAVMPAPLVERMAAGDSTEPVTARVAELMGLGGSALAAKLCATALVTGAVVGGAVVVPDIGEHSTGAPRAAESARSADEDATGDDVSPAAGQGGAREAAELSEDDRSGRGESGESGRGGESGSDDGRAEDPSGPGGSEPGDDREGTSGPGGGEEEDNSGPGGGGPEPDPVGTGPDDSSGPGGGGTDGGLSGSGSGESGSGGTSGTSGSGGDLTASPVYTSDDHSGPGGGGGYTDGGLSGSGSGEPTY